MNIKQFNVAHLNIKNQCYLVYKNSVGILIDPAWDFKQINDFLVEENVSLHAVLLTHSHDDHTNLAEAFASKFNIPVYMSQMEIEYYNFECQNIQSVFHLRKIDVSGFSILPILTPGHTYGGTSYLIENNLFSGDTVFIEGVGACVCKGSDAYKLFNSIKFLKNNLLDDTLFWPGHSFGEMPGKSLAYLRKQNIYFQCVQEEQFVRFRMRKNQPNLIDFK